jgi:hypothetical protein
MTMFDDLKKGLSEVDAFLGGENTGYIVTVPEDIDAESKAHCDAAQVR